jgi:Zn-dependent protease with chaperone function
MFENFLYFIIVLLIYATYQPSGETNFSGLESFTLAVVLVAVFFYFTLLQFRRIEKRIATGSFARLDHQFHAILMRQSILAILIFAVDIYYLNLSSFLVGIWLFNKIPTLEALLFIGLFVFYLALIWACAHGSYKKLYRSDISKQTYVLSNITFSIPVLLPWLILSGFADFLQALPFEWLARFMETAEGEVIYFLILLFFVAIMGPTLIQKFWRCKPIEPGAHRERIENLCRKAGLAYADILYWPIFGGKMITAGVMGLIKRFRYILVTPYLLRILEPDEIDAVIAHEIGHVKRKHLVFYLVFFVGYMLLYFVLADSVQWWLISTEPFYWFLNKTGFEPFRVISNVKIAVFIVALVIYFRFIFGFYMRNFERQADIYVYTLFDSAKPLISTLQKIVVTSGQSADRPNWHHFSIKERIDYLRKCESDTKWISLHHQKVKRSIGIFLAGMVLTAIVGYQMSFGIIRDRLNQNYARFSQNYQHYIETVIAKELQKSPDNPNLYRLLGDLYYNRKDYEGVKFAYEKALALGLHDPHVLNNLAWFYATCEIESLRNPERALVLAKSAVQIEQSAYILDTLAESYFVNGMYPEAIEAGEKALAMATENRAYYRAQLEKFKKAAGLK